MMNWLSEKRFNYPDNWQVYNFSYIIFMYIRTHVPRCWISKLFEVLSMLFSPRQNLLFNKRIYPSWVVIRMKILLLKINMVLICELRPFLKFYFQFVFVLVRRANSRSQRRRVLNSTYAISTFFLPPTIRSAIFRDTKFRFVNLHRSEFLIGRAIC